MANIKAGIPTVVAIATLVATWHVSTRCPIPENLELTDIAQRRPIDDIPIKTGRIDGPCERRKAGPKYKQTRASVPAESLGQVPSEPDRHGSKDEQGGNSENLVDGQHFWRGKGVRWVKALLIEHVSSRYVGRLGRVLVCHKGGGWVTVLDDHVKYLNGWQGRSRIVEYPWEGGVGGDLERC